VECPFFAVSRFQGSFDQSQEAIVLDVLSEDVPQDGVVDVIKASFDVAFDEPLRAHPGLDDLVEGCVASPFSVCIRGCMWSIVVHNRLPKWRVLCLVPLYLTILAGQVGVFPLWACR